jgi:hypothetical protein
VRVNSLDYLGQKDNLGFYVMRYCPSVNLNITESFQVRVNSLDYKRPEEQHLRELPGD